MRTRVVLISTLLWAIVTQAAVTEADLQHHRWVLESIDGNPAPSGDALVPASTYDGGTTAKATALGIEGDSAVQGEIERTVKSSASSLSALVALAALGSSSWLF